MAKKEHVVKTTNGIDERAVQVVATEPGSLVEGQIWFEKTTGKAAIFANGLKRALNVRVLPADPGTPEEGEAWINSSTNELKYKFAGNIYSINLGAGTSSSGTSEGDYYRVLTQEEMNQLSDSGILYPNYIIEDFQTENPLATFTNVNASGNALKLNPGQNSGHADYELETSTKANSVEGIAVVTPRGLKAKTITNNLDNTHTLVIAGDCTSLFAVGKKMLMFAEKIIKGEVRSVYVTGDDDYIAQMPVSDPPSYASGPDETTLVIDTPTGVDLLAHLGAVAADIRFYAYDLLLEAGADGIAGALDDIKLQDAHGLRDIRTVGGDVARKITANIGTNIDKFVAQKSPDGQMWLMAASRVIAGNFHELFLYYSTDGLATVQFMQNFLIPYGTWSYDDLNENTYVTMNMEDNMIFVHNTGKFVIVLPYLSPSTYQRQKLYYGNLLDPTPTATAFTDIGAGPGIMWSSDPGSVHIQVQTIAPDSNFDWIFVSVLIHNDHRVYDFFFKDGGATFIGGADYAYRYSYLGLHIRGFWATLEGEEQIIVVGSGADNSYPQLWKRRKSQIQAAYLATPRVFTSVYRLHPFFQGETSQYLFPTPSLFGTCFLLDAQFDSVANKLRMIYWSDSGNRTFYADIDFTAPFPGTDEVQHLAFSAVPAAGQWSLDYNGTQTSNLGFSATTTQIKNALEAIPALGVGNIQVTGSYATGFDVTFINARGKQNVIQLVIFSNTLTDVGSAPITVTPSTTTPGVLPTYPAEVNNSSRASGAPTGWAPLFETNDWFFPREWVREVWFGNQDPMGLRVGANHRFKIDPTVANRGYFAYLRSQRWSGSYQNQQAFFLQFENMNTMFGAYHTSISSYNNTMYLTPDHAASPTTYGDKLGALITFPYNAPVRTIIANLIQTWSGGQGNTWPLRNPNWTLRAKLVNVSGGIPNESSVVATSPTKYPITSIGAWNDNTAGFPFRFDGVTVTAGQQLYLVIYTENHTPSANWPQPLGIGSGHYPLLGWSATNAGGTNSATYSAGLWTARSPILHYQVLDFWVEPCKSPDTFAYPQLDTSSPNGQSKADYQPQIEFIDNTKIAFTWEHSSKVSNDGNVYATGSRLLMREFTMAASGQFATSSLVKFLGYPTSTFNPNMLMHLRLGDPKRQQLNALGLPTYAGNPDRPIRSFDTASGCWSGWATDAAWQLNSSVQGQTEDPDFKSGWCIHANTNLRLNHYMGTLMRLANDPWVLEVEFKPRTEDLDGGSHTLFEIGSNNVYRFGIANNGKLFAYYLAAIVSPSVAQTYTEATSPLVAGTYYRIRFTRGADDKMHIFVWTHANPVWVEMSYITQTTFRFGYVNYTADYCWVGSAYNNSQNTYGRIGELRFAVNQTSFADDGDYEGGSVWHHQNLGKFIVAKRMISRGGQTVTQNEGGDYREVFSEGVIVQAEKDTGFVSIRDQLLKYKKVNIAQGKKLAAKISLNRESALDSVAVQGFLLNYTKQ